MSLSLRGTFTSNNGSGNGSIRKEFWFDNEHDKKTSFVYNDSLSSQSSVSKGASSQRAVIEKPCHLFLDCCVRNKDNGGSSSKNKESSGNNITTNTRWKIAARRASYYRNRKKKQTLGLEKTSKISNMITSIGGEHRLALGAFTLISSVWASKAIFCDKDNNNNNNNDDDAQQKR